MENKLYKALIVLLLTSCVPEVETLYVDSKFTSREQDFITRARDEWVLATDAPATDIPLSFGYDTGGSFTKEDYFPGPGGDIDILYRVTTSDPGYKYLAENHDFEGMTNTHMARSNQVMILVMDRINGAPNPDKTLWAVALHEFGHWYGIYEHLESGVMSPHADGDCVDQLAVDVLCERISCGPHAGSTCQ